MVDDDDAFARLEQGVGKLLSRAVETAKLLPAASATEVTIRPGYQAVVEADPMAVSLRHVDDADLEHFAGIAHDHPRQIMNSLQMLAVKQAARVDPADVKSPAAVASAAAQVATQIVGPAVSFKGSEPDVLSKAARVKLGQDLADLYPWVLKCAAGVAIAMGVAAIVAAVFARQPVDLTGAGLAVAALSLVGLTALVIRYFVVMGFKSVEYSGGVSGTKPAEAAETDPAAKEDGVAKRQGGEDDKADGGADLRTQQEQSSLSEDPDSTSQNQPVPLAKSLVSVERAGQVVGVSEP